MAWPLVGMSTAARARKEVTRERLGRVLDGRFRLEAHLGSGGTGDVYRALVLTPEPNLPKAVAIKVLHPHLVSNPALREVFLREARIASMVAHPGVVRMFDAAVSADGTAYLVLELLDGRTLDEGLGGWGDLLLDEVVRVSTGVLEILAAAHDHGVVHCDVKPENVVVLADGNVKLLDFGVARITGQARRTGIAGTLAFMAPEQARGDWSEVDARSDVYSVGATFYTLITGNHLIPQPPARGRAGSAGPSVLPASVPPLVADVIRRALAARPEDRWSDARAMLVALGEAAQRSGIPRSSRSLQEDDDAFTLVVPPYLVSLDGLPSLASPSSRSSRPPASVVRSRGARSGLVVGALVITAAGLLGAALAVVVTEGASLRDSTRARIVKPASSAATTAAELAGH